MTGRMVIWSRKVEPDPPAPVEPRPRPTRAQLEQEAREFRAAQPLEAVPLRLPYQSVRGLTLRCAYEFIVEHGGAVESGPHGTLGFRLPAKVDPGIGHGALRRKLEDACELLDASRALVHACLSAGEELPAALPALGGGVVE